MSYDLLVVGRPGSTVARSLEYFRSRPHYTVSDVQAVYENPDTGVYFVFELPEPADSDPEADVPRGTWLALILNLYRPSVFVLEATRELLALTVATESDVYDPQADEPAVGPFHPDEIVARWNDANRRGHEAILQPRDGQELPAPPRTLPGEKLRAVWEWNHGRAAWNAELGEDVFVPRIFLFDGGVSVQTGVVWSDATPALLPRVDRVLVYRDALRPRSWLGRTKEPDLCEISWTELSPYLREPVEGVRSLAYYDLRQPPHPAALQRLITKLGPLSAPPQSLALDQVHDAELLTPAG